MMVVTVPTCFSSFVRTFCLDDHYFTTLCFRLGGVSEYEVSSEFKANDDQNRLKWEKTLVRRDSGVIGGS